MLGKTLATGAIVAAVMTGGAGDVQAQRTGTDRPSGGGGVVLNGIDQRDRNGGILFALRVKDSRVRVVAYRLAYDFYARSKELCGRNLGERETALWQDNASWHPPIAAPVSNGRFRWNRRYPLRASEGSKSRRTHMKLNARGRLTGPKTGRIKIVYRVVTYRGDTCTKVFRMSLSTKKLPPPSQFKPLPTGRWTANNTTGDKATYQYVDERIEFMRDGSRLEVEVAAERVCGADPHFMDGEPPIKRYNLHGTGTVQPSATRVRFTSDTGSGGTIAVDATFSAGRWHGVVTWNIPDNPLEMCRGKFERRWDFTTGTRLPLRD